MPTAVAARAPDAPPPADGPPRLPKLPVRREDATARHRPDIDGLRAIAILLVVAYHAKVPGFSAGFIGVDVFFVLSGFLITRLIIHEIDATGSLRLGRFWIRRGRRLLPASVLVIAVVLIAGQWVHSPLQLKSAVVESFSALTYWSNHLFAGRETDYFANANASSPLLHTWSLAVEEQFYVMWPLVFFLTSRFVRTGSRMTGAIRLLVVAALSIGSYALSIRLLEQDSPGAFFLAISRAWEFGAGAILAIVGARLSSIPTWLRRTLVATGVTLLLWAMATIGATTPFPGTAALLPVAAAAALIAAEAPSGRGLGRLLGARPMQVIGRLSYSWYLWHWPLVILGTTWLGHDNVATRVMLSVLALVPAELTRRLVENPVRRSSTLTRSATKSVAVLAAISFTGLAVGGAMWWRADRVLEDPLLGALDRALSDRVDVSGPCSDTDPDTVLGRCVGGDPAGSQLVLVLGDSHAAHWTPAVDIAARNLGLRMTSSLLGACPSIAVKWSLQTSRCGQRQADLPAMIEALDPDVVVISHTEDYVDGLLDSAGRPVPGARQLEAWKDGMSDLARYLRARGTGLLVVLDGPLFDEDPIDCMVRTRSPSACGASGDEMRLRMKPFHETERAALAAAGHGIAYDPFPGLCGDRCPTVIDGEVAYVDTNHLTATVSRTFAPDLAAALQAAAN